MHPELSQLIDDLYNEMVIDLQKIPSKEEEHFWLEANAKKLSEKYDMSEENVIGWIGHRGDMVRKEEEEERLAVDCPGCTEAHIASTGRKEIIRHMPPICRTAEEYERDRPALELDFAQKIHALCDSGVLDEDYEGREIER